MRNLPRLIFMLAVPLAAAGPALAADTSANYICDDGTQMIAHFHNAPSGPGAVTLAFPATATKMTISQKMSADGGRYAAGRVEFWIKGQQASFTQGDHKTTCKVSK